MIYYVKVIRDFDDYGGNEVKPDNEHIQRRKGDVYMCNKERYLYLKEHNVVMLVGIERA